MEYNTELYHHGIKGMKWGIRRFQNKDGSLTKAGERRRAALEGELEKLGGRKSRSNSDSNEAPRKKTIKDLSDDELRNMTNRMQLESNFYNAQRNLAAATPQKVSAGKRFIGNMMNNVIAPAATNAGKAWLEKTLKDKLGLNDKSTLDRLEEKYKTLDFTKKIKDLERDIKKGDNDNDASIDKLASMTDEEIRRYVVAANNKYFVDAATTGKGVKPDKGKNKNKDDDDD